MWPNPQETVDLVTFTEEILNGNFIFCAVVPGKVKTLVLFGLIFTALDYGFK